MNFFLRWLIATAIYLAILFVGRLLGVHPSLAEICVVALAAGAYFGVVEGLK